jgi:hypothetical protein
MNLRLNIQENNTKKKLWEYSTNGFRSQTHPKTCFEMDWGTCSGDMAKLKFCQLSEGSGPPMAQFYQHTQHAVSFFSFSVR